MFPSRCAHPPCRNIEVTSVDQKGSGMCGARSRPVEYSRGTTPQAGMKDWSAFSEGCDSSRKKAATLMRDEDPGEEGSPPATDVVVTDQGDHARREA